MKPLTWLGDSLEAVREFPPDAKAAIGYELHRVQSGADPADWKPMPAIGLGAREIRVNVGTAHRAFYVAKFAEAVYVLHAITKKTQRTPQAEIEIAARRYRQLIEQRKAR